MAQTLEYIKSVMREQNLPFFAIHDDAYRSQYEQFQAVDVKESIKRLDNFFDHAKDSLYNVYVFKTTQKKVDGTPKGSPYEYQVVLTQTLKEDTPISGTMGSMGMNTGGQGVPLDSFLGSKDEIMNLRLQVMKLEMEKEALKNQYEREITALKEAHDKEMSSENRIQGIVGQIAPMFGFGNGMNGLSGVAEMVQKETNNLSTKPSTNMENEKAKVIAAVNSLLELDPNFAENLQLLAKLAKSKPAVYKQAVTLLKGM